MEKPEGVVFIYKCTARGLVSAAAALWSVSPCRKLGRKPTTIRNLLGDSGIRAGGRSRMFSRSENHTQ